MTLTVRVAIMYVFFTYGHVCEALVDERRLCIRSLSCLLSGLLQELLSGKMMFILLWLRVSCCGV